MKTMNTMTARTRTQRILSFAGKAAVLYGAFMMFLGRHALLLALLSWILKAQTPRHHPDSDPAAIALHDRHVRVTGSATPPAFQHSIVEMRIGNGPVMRTESWIAQPDRIRVTTLVDGKEMLDFGYDGTTGWSASPIEGVVPLPKDALDALRTTATGMNAPSIDSTARAVAIGRSTFDDRLADGVRAVTAAGDTAEIYYAVSTGLMAGLRMRSAANPAANMVIMTRDYQRIGGRMANMTSIIRGPGMEAVQRTIQVDYEQIEPARFRPPTGVPDGHRAPAVVRAGRNGPLRHQRQGRSGVGLGSVGSFVKSWISALPEPPGSRTRTGVARTPARAERLPEGSTEATMT
jgi:hypothetical protein